MVKPIGVLSVYIMFGGTVAAQSLYPTDVERFKAMQQAASPYAAPQATTGITGVTLPVVSQQVVPQPQMQQPVMPTPMMQQALPGYRYPSNYTYPMATVPTATLPVSPWNALMPQQQQPVLQYPYQMMQGMQPNMYPSNPQQAMVPVRPYPGSGAVNPFQQNMAMNQARPSKKRVKAWGEERHIWPDFYTDFTDEAWDFMMRSPREMGYMPGGWRFPYISMPDPVTVGDAVANQMPPIMEEVPNFAPVPPIPGMN